MPHSRRRHEGTHRLGRRGPPHASPRLPPRHRELTDPAPPQERKPVAPAILVWLGSVVLAQVGYAIAALISGSTDLSLATLGASFAGTYVGLIGGSFLLTKGDLASAGFSLRAVDLPIGAASGLVAAFVVVPIVAWPVERLFPDSDISAAAERLADATPGWRIWVLALFVAVLTPIAEELFFRGIVQARLVPRVGAVAAVAITSVLFGLAHLQLVQLLPLIALGVVFGVLALRLRRLGPAIVAHAVFNGLTIVALATS